MCCIYKSGVKVPSDISGLLYKKDNQSIVEIGFRLIKELKSAGLQLKI